MFPRKPSDIMYSLSQRGKYKLNVIMREKAGAILLYFFLYLIAATETEFVLE